jgi:tetratricopeptide (TPR) repeat protein
MAKEPRKKRSAMMEEAVEKGWQQRAIEHVFKNPGLYALSAAMVLLAFILAGAYKMSSDAKDKRIMTEYAKAVSEEKTEDQLAKLEALSGKAGRWNAEVLYVLGETAIAEQDYERAKKAFESVRADYPNSEFAPRAVDGLAFLAENAGNYDDALKLYKEVLDKWGDTFIGKREQLNIGRVLESQEKFSDAKAAYEAQLTLFPESQAASAAQKALDGIKASHPDLFPAPPAEAAAPPTEGAGNAQGTTTPALEAAPAAPAPESAPAAPAPAPAPAN